MDKILKAIEAIKKILPEEFVRKHPPTKELVGLLKSFYEVFPRSKDETIQVQRLLKKADALFHTVSTGRNWGLGSNFPPEGIGIVINLSCLSKIIRYSHEYGYIEIEPGVTQIQVAQFLIEQNASWYIDVTGSGSETSILGNSLARGISYNYFRTERVIKLRVLLENGEEIETGFKGDEPICHLYKWGLGPDSSGLYFQSNRGIVLSATLKLEKTPEYFETFSISLAPKNRARLMDAILYLQQQDVIRCNFHLANFNRYFPVIASNLRIRTQMTEEDAKSFIGRLIKFEDWMGTGVVFGNKELVKVKKKIIISALKSIGKVRFVSDKKLKVGEFIFKRNPKILALIKIMGELRGFAIGKPSDIAVQSLSMSGSLNHPLDSKNVDHGNSGAVFYSPVGPYSKESIEGALNSIFLTAQKHQFEAAITVNAPGNQIAEYVISLHYDKNEKNTAKALNCIADIRENLNAMGIFPYRLGIWQSANLADGTLTVQGDDR